MLAGPLEDAGWADAKSFGNGIGRLAFFVELGSVLSKAGVNGEVLQPRVFIEAGPTLPALAMVHLAITNGAALSAPGTWWTLDDGCWHRSAGHYWWKGVLSLEADRQRGNLYPLNPRL